MLCLHKGRHFGFEHPENLLDSPREDQFILIMHFICLKPFEGMVETYVDLQPHLSSQVEGQLCYLPPV